MHVLMRANEVMAEAEIILCPFCHGENPRRARFCKRCGRDVVLNNTGPTFVITRIVKQGGQGAVYETVGEDGQIYAVKELHDRAVDPRERAEALGRFRAEAEILGRLRHPRIPRVHAAFEDEERHYLALDFVRGEDLEQLLSRESHLPEPRTVDIGLQLCDVLGYLHQQGLVYRDMKPSNVMLDADGVKLVDFGIANALSPTDRAAQVGTPGYSPPEQYQGITTPRSDIYALGATLHHALTGRDPRDEKPFAFPPVRELRPDISVATSAAVARALQMRPEDRFADVASFAAALQPRPARAPQAPKIARQPTAVAAARPPDASPQTQTGVPTGRTAPQRSGSMAGRFLLLLLLLAALAGGMYVFAPDILNLPASYIPTNVTQ